MASGAALKKRQIWLTVAIVLLALWIASPFGSAIAWAAVLAIAEWPLLAKGLRHFPKRTVVLALGLTTATGLFVILPLSMVATSLAAESQGALDWVTRAEATGLPAPAWLAHLPVIGDRPTEWWLSHVGSSDAAKGFLASINAGSALGWARVIAAELARESGLFLITLLALASFLIRGNDIAVQARLVASQMFGLFGEDFLERPSEAVRRTVAGTLLVSVLEGALIGGGYAACRSRFSSLS